ncbi:MAG: HNH endonuclease [Thermoanaerobaculia bacterium]
MRFWWVNQNQTHRQEVSGGYLWSPKRKANGDRNPFYEFMREVAPGDLVFSFAGSRVAAFGIAGSHAYEAPKPEEFGAAGRNWDDIGWRVDVEFHQLRKPFRPQDWIDKLRPLLPERYAPLDQTGRGLQGIYLTELPQVLALAIADLAGPEVAALARAEEVAERSLETPGKDIVLWEKHLREEIETSPVLPKTEKEQLVVARRGQGLFRERVQRIESSCRITGVDRSEHLRASHTKPWRDCTNQERLNGENGLLLTPSIDHLFDRGFISFRDDGRLVVSPVAHYPSLEHMGVPTDRDLDTGSFTQGQIRFLEYHRDLVFLRAQVIGR